MMRHAICLRRGSLIRRFGSRALSTGDATYKPLAGKTALVTGAASGIGRAVAYKFASQGADVVAVDINLKPLRVLEAEIAKMEVNVLALNLDVSSDTDNKVMIDEAMTVFERPISIAHLNAGVGEVVKPLWDTTPEEFDRVLKVNLYSVFYGLRSLLPPMIEAGTGGSIIATASVLGLRTSKHMVAAPYITSKFGVVGLVKAAAIEAAAHNIRVNAIAPGLIDTAILDSFQAPREELMSLMSMTHLISDRMGHPDEVAEMVSFLASDKASFCTGSVYPVCGGCLSA